MPDLQRLYTLDEVKLMADKLMAAEKTVNLDLETGYYGMDFPKNSLTPYADNQFIVGFSITNDVRWARYVPLRHDFGDNLDPEKVWPIMKPVLETLPVSAHNIFFEASNVEALEHKGHGPKIMFDRSKWNCTQIQSYVLSEFKDHRLKHLSQDVFGYKQAELKSLFGGKMTQKEQDAMRFNVLPISPEAINYACDDVIMSLRLDQRNAPKVQAERADIYHLEMEIVDVLIDMTRVGLAVDWGLIDQELLLYSKFTQQMELRTRKLFEESAGRDL